FSCGPKPPFRWTALIVSPTIRLVVAAGRERPSPFLSVPPRFEVGGEPPQLVERAVRDVRVDLARARAPSAPDRPSAARRGRPRRRLCWWNWVLGALPDERVDQVARHVGGAGATDRHRSRPRSGDRLVDGVDDPRGPCHAPVSRFSSTTARPWPTPMQIAATPQRALRSRSTLTSVPTI